jgi:hypothetical protein
VKTLSKLFVVVFFATSLSGCFYQTVNQYDIREAIETCGTIENVFEITSSFTGGEYVTCYGKKQHFLHK